MEQSKRWTLIKVNFPRSARDLEDGSGEGMWVIIDPESKDIYDADTEGDIITGILDNDSMDNPDLVHGTPILCETRGYHRPVCVMILDNPDICRDAEEIYSMFCKRREELA